MTVLRSSLFDQPDSIQLEWESFIAKHPEVWTEIVRIAGQALDRDVKRLSMRWVFESIRISVPREGGVVVSLNNDFTACATRQLQSERPELGALFRTRPRRAS